MHIATVDARYCPLCDTPVAAPRCEVHRVPTLHPDGPRGPVERLEVGTELVGRYRIDGLLQQGGMGVLLEATRLSDLRRIVIKVLKGQRLKDRANMRRFYQEARVARSLDHDNIVTILEFGVDEATRSPFLAMELIVGRTLKELVAREGALAERRTARLFAQICRALALAHSKGILHRDLKPSNIMVRPGLHTPEEVKVLDFGLAKIVDDDDIAPLTQPGKTVGTPAFMSPEQVTQRPQDFRSDLYGLGCMLYATLVGGPPFFGDGLVAVMRMQISSPTPSLPDVLSDGSPPSEGLIRLYRSLMQKDPDDRPASTDEVADIFDTLAGPVAAAPADPGPTLPREAALIDGVPATLVDARGIPDTDPSIDVPQLVSIEAEIGTDSHTDISEDSLDAQTAVDAVRLDSDLGTDSETPVQTTQVPQLPDADSSDDLLTTVLPQGLDDASDPSQPFADQEDGPVLGQSLLVARPVSEIDARTTVPLEPRYSSNRGEITVEPVPEGALMEPPRTLDPAEHAPPEQRRSDQRAIMIAALAVAAVLVGLAAATAWQPGSGPAQPASPPPQLVSPQNGPVVRPQAQPRPTGRGIRLKTRPDGAQVRVDGELRGTTPLWLPRPQAGKTVQVDLRKEGYESHALRLGAEGATVMEVELKAKP